MPSSAQKEYWNNTASESTFTHPFLYDFIGKNISLKSKILDYGCGYGRIVNELRSNGYTNVTGVDTSEALIKRAKNEGEPSLFTHIPPASLPYKDEAFDCIILFAVLTCIPSSNHQNEIIKEIYRALKPGGLLYVSDYLLQDSKKREGNYDGNGVFKTTQGAFFRHHTNAYLNKLFSSLSLISKREISVITLNGNKADAIQYILQK